MIGLSLYYNYILGGSSISEFLIWEKKLLRQQYARWSIEVVKEIILFSNMKVERKKNFPSSFKQGKHNFYNESNEDETLPAGQLVIFFFPPSLLPSHQPARPTTHFPPTFLLH